MIKICEMLGGSHAYSLNTSESDTDIRFVFLNSDISQIVGLNKYDHLDLKSQTEDSFGVELRHFFNLLRKGNTQGFELIWNKNWISITPEWKEIQNYKKEFTDLEKCYHCLKGYTFHERRLINAEKKGQIGKSRHQNFLKFGYSPKNAVNAIRLLWTGAFLLNCDIYPVSIKEYDPLFCEMLLNIKTQPQNYTKEQINKIIDDYETYLDKSYKKHKDKTNKTKFNEKLANKLLLKFYLPILKNHENL